MKQDLIKDVIQGMLPFLNNAQNEKLQEVLQYTLAKYEVTEKQNQENNSEQNYVELFLSAKRIEGCSEKSLKYYKATIEAMLGELNKDVTFLESGKCICQLLNVLIRKISVLAVNHITHLASVNKQRFTFLILVL